MDNTSLVCLDILACLDIFIRLICILYAEY